MADAMPIIIHDWTRVDAGTWHPFHVRWLTRIADGLNDALPSGYYADPERSAPPFVPDVLTLQEASDEIMSDVPDFADTSGGVATAVAAEPLLSLHAEGDPDALLEARQRHIAVRHESGDRLVALIELTSPANKDRPRSVGDFVDKAAAALARGVHVSIVDLLPPGKHDRPTGLCGAVADAAGIRNLQVPADKPLMIAAIETRAPSGGPTLYAEPLAVGDALPGLPVFLEPGLHVVAPLAQTYAAAWRATPRRWRRVIEN